MSVALTRSPVVAYSCPQGPLRLAPGAANVRGCFAGQDSECLNQGLR